MFLRDFTAYKYSYYFYKHFQHFNQFKYITLLFLIVSFIKYILYNSQYINMGNQWSGLQRRPHFDWIERFGNKQRSTDTITSKDVRLSADQINKIEEYHQRFIKENNPTEVFFNIDYDFKVDQG